MSLTKRGKARFAAWLRAPHLSCLPRTEAEGLEWLRSFYPTSVRR